MSNAQRARVQIPLPDDAAREAIERRLDVNIVVEAGAGSGKTHSLAARMAHGIATGAYRVGEMAAVTFTRKAAAELRGRFQLQLEERLREAKGEEEARLSAALSDIEQLFAGTIHSFCARLLRERPIEAGVPPGFDELDEVAAHTLRQQVLREYMAAALAAGTPEADALHATGLSVREVTNAFERLCTFDEVEFPAPWCDPPDTTPVWQAAEAFAREIGALLPDPVPKTYSCKALAAALEFIDKIDVADPGRPADVVWLVEAWAAPKAMRMTWWRPDGTTADQKQVRDRYNEIAAGFAGVVGPFMERWRHHVYGVVVPMLVGVRDAVRATRRRRGTLDYNDLLQGAATLLEGARDVRRALQQKYRWLFVDEFQDTDPIQARVVLALAADEPDIDDGVPLSARRLRPGSLFIVGDPKQSIYRFRRADIAVYNDVRDRIVGDGGLLCRLVTSFRSQPAICTFVNDVFDTVMGRVDRPEQPAFVDLTAVRPKVEGEGVFTLDTPGRTEQQARLSEARAIATFIASEVAAGRRRFGDFLVLTRVKSRLAVLERALEAARLPFEVSGAGAFGDSPHVKTLYRLLAALAEPANEAALVGVLRGPLFGLSDRALYAYRQAGGIFSLSLTPTRADGDDGDVPEEATTPDVATSAADVAAAMRTLRTMRRIVQTLPLAAAVHRIVEQSGLLAAASASASDAEPAGDLLHAVDRVRAVAESGGGFVDAVVSLADDIMSSEVESVPLEPGRDDVVRVMNLHKAKGLEAPVVFLADGSGRTRLIPPDVRIVRGRERSEGWLVVRQVFDSGASKIHAQPQGWDAHVASETPFIEAERVRQLYVATTRACEQLFVCRWAGGRENRTWGAIDAWLAGKPQVDVPVAATDAADPGHGDETDERDGWDADAEGGDEAPGDGVRRDEVARPPVDMAVVERLIDEARRDRRARAAVRARLREPSYVRRAVTSLAHEGAPSAGERVEEEEGGDAPIERGPATGMAWGDLVHRLIEWAVTGRATDRASLVRAARWVAGETPTLSEVVGEAVETVERVMALPVWSDIMASPERYAEVPFALRREGVDGATELLHGIIDLVYRTPLGWCVLDWKSDQVPGGDAAVLVERYRPQLRAYVEAWSELSGTDPAQIVAGLVVIRLGEVRWVAG